MNVYYFQASLLYMSLLAGRKPKKPNFQQQSKLTELQSCTKYLEQYREIQYNWTGQETFNLYFCMFLDCHCQSLISGRETGHKAMFPLKFKIYLIFPYFLRS